MAMKIKNHSVVVVLSLVQRLLFCPSGLRFPIISIGVYKNTCACNQDQFDSATAGKTQG